MRPGPVLAALWVLPVVAAVPGGAAAPTADELRGLLAGCAADE